VSHLRHAFFMRGQKRPYPSYKIPYGCWSLYSSPRTMKPTLLPIDMGIMLQLQGPKSRDILCAAFGLSNYKLGDLSVLSNSTLKCTPMVALCLVAYLQFSTCAGSESFLRMGPSSNCRFAWSRFCNGLIENDQDGINFEVNEKDRPSKQQLKQIK